MAPFGLLLTKNIIAWLNPPNFEGHSEDFRPILRIWRKIPKIGGAERSAPNYLFICVILYTFHKLKGPSYYLSSYKY